VAYLKRDFVQLLFYIHLAAPDRFISFRALEIFIVPLSLVLTNKLAIHRRFYMIFIVVTSVYYACCDQDQQ